MTQRKPRKAGRRPGPPEQRKVRLTVTLDPADVEWLRARTAVRPEGNSSALIRALIREKRNAAAPV